MIDGKDEYKSREKYYYQLMLEKRIGKFLNWKR